MGENLKDADAFWNSLITRDNKKGVMNFKVKTGFQIFKDLFSFKYHIKRLYERFCNNWSVVLDEKGIVLSYYYVTDILE